MHTAHTCTACQGRLTREPAEELWFHTESEERLYRLHSALRDGQIIHKRDAALIKVPLATAALPIVQCLTEVLDATELAQVRVVWLIRGTTAAPSVIASAPTLQTLYHELRHAWFTHLLDERRLYMHFQPIVSLHAPEIVAHEALVRAQHDGRELSGGEIVGLAEALGLVVALDARTRVAAIEGFAESGLRSKLFINFRPSAIYNPRFCLRTTIAALERTTLNPHDIVFEVVESEDITDIPHLLEIVAVYRSHGLQFAMDDFGVSYSTPERFLQLQPDYVKLDKQLTHLAADDHAVRGIIQRIVQMAADNGGCVIGEGIETLEQRDLLRDLGVELGQGYLYARPALRPTVRWPGLA